MRNPEGGPQPEEEQPSKETVPEIEKGRGEIVTYTPEEVTAFLTEGKFLEALQTASNVTYDTGHESGFIVFGSEDKHLYIPYVTEGGTAHTYYVEKKLDDVPTTIAREIDGKEATRNTLHQQPYGMLMNLHFHPNAEETIIPSSADLSSMIRSPKKVGGETQLLQNFGMSMIARVDTKKNIEVLMLDGNNALTTRKVWDYDEALDELVERVGYDYITNKDMNVLFRALGLTTKRLRYDHRDGKLQMPDESKQRLRKQRVQVYTSTKPLTL